MLNLLSAALAFAIVMFFLSVVVSVLVETIHRFMRQREKGLQLMLGHLYDRLIGGFQPPAPTEEASKLRKAFVDLMSVNRAPAGTAFQGTQVDRSDDSSEKDSWTRFGFWNGRRLAALDVAGFMNRLGSSEFGDAVGAAVKNLGPQEREAVIKDIAVKFEDFGKEASEFFQRRARLFSVIVSLFAAYFFYVHPLELFKTFLHDPELAQKVIAMQEQLTKELNAKDAEDPQLKVKLEEVKKLQEMGVPIGWNDERLKTAGFRMADLSAVYLSGVQIPVPCLDSEEGTCAGDTKYRLATFLWLLLGGILVGLGGPFWTSIIQSLTSIRSGLGGLTADEGGGGSGTKPVPEVVKAFDAGAGSRAATAKIASAPARRRSKP